MGDSFLFIPRKPGESRLWWAIQQIAWLLACFLIISLTLLILAIHDLAIRLKRVI